MARHHMQDKVAEKSNDLILSYLILPGDGLMDFSVSLFSAFGEIIETLLKFVKNNTFIFDRYWCNLSDMTHMQKM